MWLDQGKEITGKILKSDLDALPDRIKDEFLEIVSITGTTCGYVDFSFSSMEVADKIYPKIRRWEKNRDRSKLRKESMQTLSSGNYNKEDIEAIFKAQEGCCYYTGQTLQRTPKNYSIDHVIPIAEGGCSWPENIVLCLTSINREKHNRSKRKLFSILKKRYGQEWYDNQRKFCKKVDRIRLKIDIERKRAVIDRLRKLEIQLQDYFPSYDIEYSLVADDIMLFVNEFHINFKPSFLRQKNCFSFSYISGIISAIVNKNA